MKVAKKYLYLTAALIWSVPGVIISIKGLVAYGEQPASRLWWLLLVTVIVLLFFYVIFSRLVERYCRRIASLTDPVSIWQTFPLRGWIMILFMCGLGVVLGHVSISQLFVASFYSGLGPQLVWSGVKFLREI
ncbi:MAG: hypothetical protein IJ377_00900 [Rikenellaceae bacterium]|nr:hypothetical protein [Rikenellaceae bacterium]